MKKSLSSLIGYRVSEIKPLKVLVACALLTALAIVFKTVLQFSFPMFGVKSQEINFSYAILMFSGYLFGPLWGGAVGAAADLIACLISGEGAPIIGITVTNFLVGALPGVLQWISRRKKLPLWTVIPFTLVLTSLASLHNSWWIKLIYVPGKAYWLYALPRLAFTVLIIFPLNTVILYILLTRVVPALKRTGFLPKERI